jgi:hypothetical protein
VTSGRNGQPEGVKNRPRSLLCQPKTSSRSTSHRINNIPVDLLWRVAREDKASNIVTFGRKQPLKNQTEFLVGAGLSVIKTSWTRKMNDLEAVLLRAFR